MVNWLKGVEHRHTDSTRDMGKEVRWEKGHKCEKEKLTKTA